MGPGGPGGGQKEATAGADGYVVPYLVVLEEAGGGTGEVDEENVGVAVMIGFAKVDGRAEVLMLEDGATLRIRCATQFYSTRQSVYVR